MANFGGCVAGGVLSALSTYSALDQLLDGVNREAIILQKQLSNAPEFTEQVYRTASEASKRMVSGDYHAGLITAAIAGFFIGVTIYSALIKSP